MNYPTEDVLFQYREVARKNSIVTDVVSRDQR
jgi:hypothetical protein